MEKRIIHGKRYSENIESLYIKKEIWLEYLFSGLKQGNKYYSPKKYLLCSNKNNIILKNTLS